MNLTPNGHPASRLRPCHPDPRVADYLEHRWWSPLTVLDLLDDQIHRRGSAPAVTDPSNLVALCGIEPEALSWQELGARVEDLAAKMHSSGIGPGDVVAVLMPNSVALTATYLALWRLGAIAAPMPASYRQYELTRIVDSARAVAVVTVNSLGDRTPSQEALGVVGQIPSLRTVFTFGPPSSDQALPLDAAPAGETSVETVRRMSAALPRSVNDCITICWTSGTEAAPKGVPRCHGDWIAIGQAVQDGLETDPTSVMLNPFPMVNMAGFATSLLPWLLGGGHLIHHHPLDLAVYLEQLQRYRVTHTSMPPAILTMLLQREDLRAAHDLSALRRVGSGGAPLPPTVVRDWQQCLGVEVLNFFGSNEGVCLLGSPADTPDPLIRAEYLPNYGSTTRTWTAGVARHTTARLVDPATGEQITTIGGRGELRLKGPTIFMRLPRRDRGVEPVRRGRIPVQRRHFRAVRARRRIPQIRRPEQGDHHPRRDEHRSGRDRRNLDRPPRRRRRGNRRVSRRHPRREVLCGGGPARR